LLGERHICPRRIPSKPAVSARRRQADIAYVDSRTGPEVSDVA
jgi:hypothetical protein